jgi:DNA polymerase III delta prime subunit
VDADVVRLASVACGGRPSDSLFSVVQRCVSSGRDGELVALAALSTLMSRPSPWLHMLARNGNARVALLTPTELMSLCRNGCPGFICSHFKTPPPGVPDRFIVVVADEHSGDSYCLYAEEATVTKEEGVAKEYRVYDVEAGFCRCISRSITFNNNAWRAPDGVEPCSRVRLKCRSYPGTLEYGKILAFGQKVGECTVTIARPSPCYLSPVTEVDYAPDVSVSVEEHGDNVAIEVVDGATRKVYVYPRKVWEEVYERVVKPLSEGRMPAEMGMILAGPPGVGKTSMVELLTAMLGVPTVTVTANEILSKWLGESEKRLAKKLEEAERSEPSILLFDEAEWIARSRELEGPATSVENVHSGMLGILLQKITAWQKAGIRVFTCMTTNISPDKLDAALRRSGRLGRPIYIPLPDFEAVKLYMIKMGIPKNVAENMAQLLVSAGAEMSLVERVTKELLAGKRPEEVKIEPQKERGYVRPVLPLSVTREDMTLAYTLVEEKPICSILADRVGRIHLKLPQDIAIPVAIAIARACNKPAVLLRNPDMLDEALAVAETSKGVLIVPSESVRDLSRILYEHKLYAPVIFCGERELVNAAGFIEQAYTLTLDSMGALTKTPKKTSLASIVIKYYNPDANLTGRDLHMLASMENEKLIALLRKVAYIGRGLKPEGSRSLVDILASI